MNKYLNSSNPIISEEAMQKATQTMPHSLSVDERMTVAGAVNKTWILGALMLMTAAYSYMIPSTILMWVGAIGGLGVLLWATFKKEMSPTLAPIYAMLEGLFVGGITYIYGSMYEGIVFQAVTLTMAVFFTMLILYQTGTIKVTDKLRSGIIMATGGIFLVYMVDIGLSFFGMNVPMLHENGIMGIGISLVIVGVAAFNLLLDFDLFERGEEMGAPKWMEWFAAMGLLVTIIWLYVEMLRLMSKLASRD